MTWGTTEHHIDSKAFKNAARSGQSDVQVNKNKEALSDCEHSGHPRVDTLRRTTVNASLPELRRKDLAQAGLELSE